MTKLLALLTKEMRLRMRRERTVWVLVTYVLLLGMLGWLTIRGISTSTSSNINIWNKLGSNLYHLLTIVQLLLILLITPAFTASAINGEKERQTFDLLLCSRLSSFSLLFGKLVAGFSNALLLIVAAVPLFSLVFFFGGINPQQIYQDQLVFILTAILIATFGLFCSSIFTRPAVSTAVTYLVVLLWAILPVLITAITPQQVFTNRMISTPANIIIRNGVATSTNVIWSGPIGGTPQPTTLPLLTIWNPLALFSGQSPYGGLLNGLFSTYYYAPAGNMQYYYQVAGLRLTPWLAYMSLSAIAIVVFFSLGLLLVKPHLLTRLRSALNRTAGMHRVATP